MADALMIVVAQPKLVPMLPKERTDAARLLAALMLAARTSPICEQVDKRIGDPLCNAGKEPLPPSEPDQHPAQYPAQYGARHDAHPSLRGIATDERAGDKG